MPTTRSMRSLSSLVRKPETPPKSPRPSKTKRKVQDADVSESSPQIMKKQRVYVPSNLGTPSAQDARENEILPAVLTFSLETAKNHLISVDSRFKGVFSRLPCRPFEQLERVDPFRTLTSSILGQQISWLAARSIRHRFIRLYDPSLPEKPPANDSDAANAAEDFFPTASQVTDTDIVTLKSAGLSTRKAEYIKDLASHFADGRFTNKKLVEADDEELANLLIDVRGIGRWTVDMFAMFSLRRPDILPVGDLGVQRGMIRWFLSLHSPSDPITISPKKQPKPLNPRPKDQDASPDVVAATAQIENETQDVQSDIPLPPRSSFAGSADRGVAPVPVTPVKGGSKLVALSQTPDKVGLDTASLPMLPEPFTPSINNILKPNTEVKMEADGLDGNVSKKMALAPLPEGLSVAVLKSRLNGKKKIKGALLTPKEMEELAEPWRPYRSLGVYYMWALTDETTTEMV